MSGSALAFTLSLLALSGQVLAPPAVSTTAAATTSAEVGTVRIVGRCEDRLGTSQLVTDRHGVSTAAWGCDRHVYAARTRPDGSWGAPVDLAIGLEPKAVVDRRGRVTLLYRHLQGNGIESRRWAHDHWQAAVDLTFQTGADVVFVQWATIATNGRGDTVAVWTQNDGKVQSGPTPVLVAAYRHAGGRWLPTVRVGPKGVAAAALVDGFGRALVFCPPDLYRRTTAGRWHAPETLPLEGGFVGAATNGPADLLVTDHVDDAVVARERPEGASWLPGVEVGSTPWPGAKAPVVLRNDGTAAVAYADGASSAVVVTREAGEAWAAATRLSPTGVNAAMPRVASGFAGTLAVSWTQGPLFTRQLWVSSRLRSGDWSPPIRVTGPGWRHVDHLSLTLRPDGAAVLAWTGRVVDKPGWRFGTRVVSFAPM